MNQSTSIQEKITVKKSDLRANLRKQQIEQLLYIRRQISMEQNSNSRSQQSEDSFQNVYEIEPQENNIDLDQQNNDSDSSDAGKLIRKDIKGNIQIVQCMYSKNCNFKQIQKMIEILECFEIGRSEKWKVWDYAQTQLFSPSEKNIQLLSQLIHLEQLTKSKESRKMFEFYIKLFCQHQNLIIIIEVLRSMMINNYSLITSLEWACTTLIYESQTLLDILLNSTTYSKGKLEMIYLIIQYVQDPHIFSELICQKLLDLLYDNCTDFHKLVQKIFDSLMKWEYFSTLVMMQTNQLNQ